MADLQQKPITSSIPNKAGLKTTTIPESSLSTTKPAKIDPRPKPKVEILELKDYKKAARTLYQAFAEDKVAQYCSRHLEKDPELRRKCDTKLLETFVYSYVTEGVVLVVKGDANTNGDGVDTNAADDDDSTFETVAIWATPESEVETTTPLDNPGFAEFASMTGPEGCKRVFGQLFNVLQDKCDEVMGVDVEGKDIQNLWTLVYIGSTPASRGKGNVRAMFEYMAERFIDPVAGIGYLESSNLTNTSIYEKFGFKPVLDVNFNGDLAVGDDDEPDHCRMDIMVRGVRGGKWKYLDDARRKFNYVVPDYSKLQ
ncbi:unnamed protein product [Ambrosiozyma monospora]|uniref:Unnamed protein product n=1 Tax=Ambrosiozyma monospora TaxID=43982 RepID=A0ACB5TJG6_AMBMO|nr:unnamed protein product [Ambrosiozyma monospora]